MTPSADAEVAVARYDTCSSVRIKSAVAIVDEDEIVPETAILAKDNPWDAPF